MEFFYSAIVVSAILCLRSTDAALVVKPTDHIGTALLHTIKIECKTDTNGSVSWFHTPPGANSPIKFFSNGSIVADGFYKTDFKVYRFSREDYDLCMTNPKSQHVGKYECREDEDSTASAEVGFLVADGTWQYVFVANSTDYVANSTDVEVTCNVSLLGKPKPTMKCLIAGPTSYGAIIRSSPSSFGRYDNDVPGASYVSRKVTLPLTEEKLDLYCYLTVGNNFFGVDKTLVVYRSSAEEETEATFNEDIGEESVNRRGWTIRSECILYTLGCLAGIFALTTCVMSILYIRLKRSMRVPPRRVAEDERPIMIELDLVKIY